MRFCRALLLVVCAGALASQSLPGDGLSDTADMARTQAGIEKLRQLVDAGAAPRVELEQAEEALADARDFAFLKQTLYGDLTEAQADAMIAAAGRRLERRRKALAKAQQLVDLGVAGEVSLGTFREAVDWSQKEYDLALSRARQVREASAMATAEQALHEKLEVEPQAAHGIAERYDGNGIFTSQQFHRIEQAYESRFSRPLPVSAMGETAVHRALGFDHRGRVDVAVNPSQPEGIWLRDYLEANQIPFFAFWQAVPGKATGAHIHIGPMSTRLAHGG